MKRLKRYIVCLLVLVISFSTLVACTQQNDQKSDDKYPERAINMLIGLAPGGSTDLVSRAMADAASKVIGQPIVAENREGGAQAVALTNVSNSKPDGYTLGVLISSAGTVNPILRDVPYDPINDFQQICRFGVYTYTLSVKADAPWDTLEEFLTYAKENPGLIKYGVASSGSSPMIAMEQLGNELGINWEGVPVGNGAKAVTNVLGNHLHAAAVAGEDLPHVESGDMKVLAILSSEKSANLPGIKTLVELGYDVAAPAYLNIVGPKDMPESVIKTLEKAFQEGTKSEEFINVMNSMNIAPAYLNSSDTEKFIIGENEKFEKILGDLDLE